MIRWIDWYFSEFTHVFPSFGKVVLAALECTPFPMDLAEKEVEDVLNLYRQTNPLRKKQSIVFLCGKLLKVLHAISTSTWYLM